MRLKSALLFALKAGVVGLAAAFVLLLRRPELILPEPTTVEIQETAPVALTSRSAQGPYSYAAAVEKAAPAVVNINTAKVVTVRPNPFFDDPVFRQFFGRNLEDMVGPRQRVETSLGSGVIVSEQGFVITNHHVIREADAIQVALRDGRTAEAKVVGSDPDTDLAVLKINLTKLPTITLGQSERVRIGDVVLAIGNPFGVGQTVTMGIVSATGRNRLGINTFENFIQTDAAINPGNSGGALVNARGELVGINTAIFSQSGGSHGIGFAIPVDMAKTVLDQISRHGKVIRGWLGVEARDLPPSILQQLPVPGVVVAGIFQNGPADRAGLQRGDVIIEINRTPTTNTRTLLSVITDNTPGSELTIKVLRNNQPLELKARLMERPPLQS